jgi:hypothetical protein
MPEPFAALQEYNVYKPTSLDYASLDFNLTYVPAWPPCSSFHSFSRSNRRAGSYRTVARQTSPSPITRIPVFVYLNGYCMCFMPQYDSNLKINYLIRCQGLYLLHSIAISVRGRLHWLMFKMTLTRGS